MKQGGHTHACLSRNEVQGEACAMKQEGSTHACLSRNEVQGDVLVRQSEIEAQADAARQRSRLLPQGNQRFKRQQAALVPLRRAPRHSSPSLSLFLQISPRTLGTNQAQHGAVMHRRLVQCAPPHPAPHPPPSLHLAVLAAMHHKVAAASAKAGAQHVAARLPVIDAVLVDVRLWYLGAGFRV